MHASNTTQNNLQVPYEALSLALAPDTARPVDVALVNGQCFANLATVGPISGVSSKDMSPGLKRVLGPAAVAVAGGRRDGVCRGAVTVGAVCGTRASSFNAQQPE